MRPKFIKEVHKKVQVHGSAKTNTISKAKQASMTNLDRCPMDGQITNIGAVEYPVDAT